MIINAINENFNIHRRLLLTIVIKINERKNKNFIADNAKKKKKILLLTTKQTKQ